MKKLLASAAAGAALLAAAFCAQAGGPLGTCYGSPVKYPGNGSVALRYDQGTLGSRSKASADAIVSNAISYWTNVGTSTVSLTRAADLPVDVTTANVRTYYGVWSDGINPVIYDTNGTIIDMLLGTGASNSVLGFAGSAWNDTGISCSYVEGQAVINGKIAVSDAVMTTVIAHEVGHLIGLDHTQLDASQGIASSNYPLMYPIAYRSLLSLHEDDVAAVTALYPDTTVNAGYGQISGTFTTATGTPVRGANIFAQGTGGNFSIVSDYLEQNTGAFRMLLPPGTYTLRAEALDTSFTGGSSVGPFSEDWTQPSFQRPIFSTGGTSTTAPSGPMATVTLGNASPTQVTITAGCAATATFRMDGTGSIGGNCGGAVPAVPATTSPSGTVVTMTPAFTWSAVSGATSYDLLVRTSAGADVYTINYTSSAAGCAAGTGTCTATPSALLANGAYNWFARARNASGASNYSAARAFTVSGSPPAAPLLVAPTGTITTGTPNFTWNAVPNVSFYNVRIRTSTGTDVSYTGYSAAGAGCAIGTGACNIAAPVTLAPGSYTWTLMAQNGFGNSAWSTSLGFTVSTGGAIPVAPVGSSPSGAITTLSPTFLWTPSPGATGYTVRVTAANGSVNSSGALTLAQAMCPKNTSLCGFVFPAELLNNTSYTWQVAASNSAGNSAFSPAVAFSTNASAPAPAAPVPAAPSGTITTLTPTFLWTPSPGATGYTVRMTAANGSVTSFGPLSLVQAMCPRNAGVCGYAVPASTPIANNTSFTWQVAASNTAGTSAFSAGLAFATSAVTGAVPPDAPVLASPSGAITSVRPTFLWSVSPGATSYTIRVMNGSTVAVNATLSLANALCPTNAGACGYLLSSDLAGSTTYTWQVAASNSAGSSVYSAASTFTTPEVKATPTDPAPTPPAPPPPVDPAQPADCPTVTQTIRDQPMFAGGSNNYAFDSLLYTNAPNNGYPGAVSAPANSIQVYELPKNWSDGPAITFAQISFASHSIYSLGKYEVSISRCKGDFTTYKTATVVDPYGQTRHPCGLVSDNQNYLLSWNVGPSTGESCGVKAGETWYLNWRLVPDSCVNAPGGTCGQTFYIPRG